MRKCTECDYALEMDYGYSNWTTEGTDFICLLDEHPDGEFDMFYGEDERLFYAEKCNSYLKGKPTHLNVEDGLEEALEELEKGTLKWNKVKELLSWKLEDEPEARIVRE